MTMKLMICRTTRGVEYWSVINGKRRLIDIERENRLEITLKMTMMIDVFRNCGYKIEVRG